MPPEAWENLVLVALAALYVIQIALDIAWHNVFGNVGIDFAAFWSAGAIANRFGYARVYDLQLMQQVQRSLLPATATAAALNPIPTPFLAVFILPFQLLALLPPTTALWLWMAINLLAFILYLRYFIARTTGLGASGRVLTLVCLSLPAFLTIFDGQVNVWLAICIGEFIRASLDKKAFRAGLWLGGLLLKPQLLIVLFPALLLQRAFRAIAGFGVALAAVLASSTLLGGTGGLKAVVSLWLNYAGGLPTNDVQLMMNWRMLGLQISYWAASIGLVIAIAGTAITFLLALLLWIQPIRSDSQNWMIAVTGTLAATGAVAWHSHAHTAIIMIPALVFLYLTARPRLGPRLQIWVFVPAVLYILRLILASLWHQLLLPTVSIVWIDSLVALGLFGLNLYFLGWALQQVRSPQP